MAECPAELHHVDSSRELERCANAWLRVWNPAQLAPASSASSLSIRRRTLFGSSGVPATVVNTSASSSLWPVGQVSAQTIHQPKGANHCWSPACKTAPPPRGPRPSAERGRGAGRPRMGARPWADGRPSHSRLCFICMWVNGAVAGSAERDPGAPTRSALALSSSCSGAGGRSASALQRPLQGRLHEPHHVDGGVHRVAG